MIKKLKERKGFTMAELLIVVAIIAVLVAVSIPVFTANLEKSRQAADAANIRAAYAEAAAKAMESDNGEATSDSSVKMTHTGNFEKLGDEVMIGKTNLNDLDDVTKDKTYKVKIEAGGTIKLEPTS